MMTAPAEKRRGPGRPRIRDEDSGQINIRLPESLLDWLQAESRAAGDSGRTAVIRRLIDQEIERRKKKTAL